MKAGKIEKLRKNHQFQKVYKDGKAQRTAKTILFIKKNGLYVNRLGVSVSKKVGKSVVRHRLKRLYLEAFRFLKKYIKKEGYDLVIIARKKAVDLSYAEAVRDLKKLLARGKLVNEKNNTAINKDL
ncbi:MAG: ribonuclease P protein component [Firmicutes bacterium]|nr:ribonuclease P protein component [Bacillota bacterium]